MPLGISRQTSNAESNAMNESRIERKILGIIEMGKSANAQLATLCRLLINLSWLDSSCFFFFFSMTMTMICFILLDESNRKNSMGRTCEKFRGKWKSCNFTSSCMVISANCWARDDWWKAKNWIFPTMIRQLCTTHCRNEDNKANLSKAQHAFEMTETEYKLFAASLIKVTTNSLNVPQTHWNDANDISQSWGYDTSTTELTALWQPAAIETFRPSQAIPTAIPLFK